MLMQNDFTPFQSLDVSGFLQTQNKKIQRKFSKAAGPDGRLTFSEKNETQLTSLEPGQGIFLIFSLSLVLRIFVEFKCCINVY